MLTQKTVHIPRQRLYDIFDASRVRDLVWIHGPPGIGKTTLVNQYVADRGLPHIWIQLDQCYEDTAAFLLHLLEILDASTKNSSKKITKISYLWSMLEDCLNKILLVPERCPLLILDYDRNIKTSKHIHDVTKQIHSIIQKRTCLFVLSRNEPSEKFIRQQTYGDLLKLGWTELRFTQDEALLLAEAYRNNDPFRTLSDDRVFQLYQAADGWIVALKLFFEKSISCHFVATESIINSTMPLIDEFFKTELFDSVDSMERHALVASALMPCVRPTQLNEWQSIQDAGEILKRLKKQGFFLEESNVDHAEYRFHPIFQRFLCHRAEEIFTKAQLQMLYKKAADWGAQAGDKVGAALLLYKAEAWPELVQLILEQAPHWMEQGQMDSLLDWIERIPQPITSQNPWLNYWKGIGQLTIDPANARVFLEKAFLLFDRNAESNGVYLAWGGIADSFSIEWADWNPADKWISRYKEIREHYPAYLSLEAQFCAYKILPLLVLRQPTHPHMKGWATEALTFLHAHLDQPQSLMLGMDLILYYTLMGDITSVEMIYSLFEERQNKLDVSLPERIYWCFMEAHHHWFKGKHTLSIEWVNRGIVLGQEHHIQIYEPLLYSQAIYACLVVGEIDQAEAFLTKIPNQRSHLCYMAGSHYYFLKSKITQQREDINSALKYAKLATKLAEQAGTPTYATQARIHAAHLMACHGDSAESNKQLEIAEQFGASFDSLLIAFITQVTRALIAFEHSDIHYGRKTLSAALELRRKIGGVGFGYWGPKQLVLLFAEALKAGFEIDYVKQLIREYQLQPRLVDLIIEQWPWPVKIYTFGRLSVIVGEKTQQSKGKGQRKPLELLMYLLARGGRNVNQAELCDALWPDADGDTAYRTLITTLQRLRKLLKEPKAVELTNGFLRLNSTYVWVDAWAFERLLSNINQGIKQSDTEFVQLHEQVLGLYKGPFLENVDEPWVVPLRERLRIKYRHHCLDLCHKLEMQNETNKATEIYLQAINADETNDFFAGQLIEHYHKIGREGEIENLTRQLQRLKRNIPERD